MCSYYYTSKDKLNVGTLLEPHYGEAMQHPGYFTINDHQYAQHLREMIFEEVRKEDFPGHPSRLNSMYLVDSLEMARKYAKKYNNKYIYEVNMETSGRILAVDMHWMDLSNRQCYNEVKRIAKAYYSGEMSDSCFLEHLFEGKVSVLQIHEIEES